MNLHTNKEDFEDLCALTSDYIGISEGAVKRDYYIVMLLQNLQNINFASECVFKGGTSLSKCYPESINRFSEGIDLTFIPKEELSNNQYSKTLKKYDVTQLYKMKEIKNFINDKRNLKNLVKKIKETDSFYLEKRNKPSRYNPLEKYNFNLWKRCFTDDVKKSYESLHENLVYGNKKQNFKEAMETFDSIGSLFQDIDE